MRTKLLFCLMLLSIAAFGQQNPIQIDANGLTQTLASGGLVNRGQIVKLNSSGQVVSVLTTDTSGAIGIAATSQQNQGQSVTVSIAGTTLVQIDSGGCVAGNVISISTITGGAGHCASTAVGQQIGIAQSISSPGSNFWNILINFAGSGGIPPNTPLPAASSGPGPVFNVKNYGAKGDSQSTNVNACTSNGSTTITCTGTAFSSTTDVGKNWFCSNGSSDFYTSLTKIVTVNSATSITTDQAALFSGFTCTGLWGTIDDTAVSTASTAAVAASKGIQQLGNKGILSSAPHLYFPAGGYLLCTTLAAGVVSLGSTVDGFVMEGDGPDQSILYSGAANGGVICPFTGNNNLGSFLQVASGATNVHLRGITFDGAFQFGGLANAVSIAGQTHVSDVVVQRWSGNNGIAFFVGGGIIQIERLLLVNNSGVGFQCNGCQGVWESGGSSNNASAANVIIAGVTGSNTSSGFRLGKGILVDECGSNPTGCTQIVNSHDVWFEGPALFGTSSGFCVNVDPNSYLHWDGGICGAFGNDINVGGPKIQAGGTLQESDVRNIGTGLGKCVTNAGVFLDNGNNSCENMYPVTSSTSTGTTAVLTISNPSGVGASTNCTIGDSLLVEGNSVPGYNGYFPAAITAVNATTITYLTQGSNIGAGGSGSVTCRNLQSYSGTLPKALLNNPIPNTCYITGTFAATTAAAPMCAFKLGSATNINFIKAASTTTTACTVAPVVTISDGTVSETLTITTAKSIWDSSVDASTGVGTSIFKPNGTITLSNTVGTCTTPPTNFSVSYNITPILSN